MAATLTFNNVVNMQTFNDSLYLVPSTSTTDPGSVLINWDSTIIAVRDPVNDPNAPSMPTGDSLWGYLGGTGFVSGSTASGTVTSLVGYGPGNTNPFPTTSSWPTGTGGSNATPYFSLTGFRLSLATIAFNAANDPAANAIATIGSGKVHINGATGATGSFLTSYNAPNSGTVTWINPGEGGDYLVGAGGTTYLESSAIGHSTMFNLPVSQGGQGGSAQVTWADYANQHAAVTVYLANNSAGASLGTTGTNTGVAVGDTYSEPVSAGVAAGTITHLIGSNGGNDTLTANNLGDTIEVGSGDVTVNGGSGGDTILAFKGSTIGVTAVGTPGGGNDTIVLGAGKNSVTLGNGNDTISGGGAGASTIKLGTGTDSVSMTGKGAVTATFGAGSDTYTLNTSGKATITEAAGGTLDLVVAGVSSKATIAAGWNGSTDNIDLSALGALNFGSVAAKNTVVVSYDTTLNTTTLKVYTTSATTAKVTITIDGVDSGFNQGAVTLFGQRSGAGLSGSSHGAPGNVSAFASAAATLGGGHGGGSTHLVNAGHSMPSLLVSPHVQAA